MFLDFILLDRETKELKKMNIIMKPLKDIYLKDTNTILATCSRLRLELLSLNVKKAKRYLDGYLELLDTYENICTNTGGKHNGDDDS